MSRGPGQNLKILSRDLAFRRLPLMEMSREGAAGRPGGPVPDRTWLRGWRCRHPFPARVIGSHARFQHATVRDWARLARYVVPIAARTPSRDACPGIRWPVRFEFVRLDPRTTVPGCRWPVRFEFVPGSPGQGKSDFVPGPRDKTHVPGFVTRNRTSPVFGQ